MKPIDQQFRFTRDFCLVWVLLVIPVTLLARHLDFGPWYSTCSFVALGSLLAALVIYGPVLLARQVVRSGPRGWFVLRISLLIVLGAALILGGMYVSGVYTETRARWLVAFFYTGAATAWLSANQRQSN